MQYIIPSVATGLISTMVFALVRPVRTAASMDESRWPFISQKIAISRYCSLLSRMLSDIDLIGAERLWCAIEAFLQFSATQPSSPMKQSQCSKLLHECKQCMSRVHESIKYAGDVGAVVMAEMHLQDLETQLALILENFVRGV